MINRELKKAAYLQLYERIKKEIVAGNYTYGSRLPSKRVLASEEGVSSITVKHAYELLCDEGFVESRERSGYYVAFRFEDGFAASEPFVTNEISEEHEVHKSFQNVGSAVSTFPLTVLTKTMRRVINDYGEVILEKSPNAGCVELREAIRRYLARNRNIHADIEQIIIGSGAEYLYSMIVGILGTERIFALESPSYQKIEQVYRMAGVSCDLLRLGEDGIRSSALADTKASVLHLSPYRSFPTGITASASKRYEYLRWTEQPDHYIVEDDFESEFSLSSKPEETLFSLTESEKVIYINTFSRTISPSLRAGYMVLPRHLVKRYTDRLGFCSCTVPAFEQFVLAELIENGDFERHINRVRRAKRKELSST